jgi:hypothetical protein
MASVRACARAMQRRTQFLSERSALQISGQNFLPISSHRVDSGE